MQLSKRSHYALRALVDLGIAQALGHPLVRAADLAEKEKLPLKFLEQIFLQLKQAGYLDSKRGSQGGYFLALPAGEIRMGAVLRLLEGPLAPLPCVSRTAYAPCTCPDEASCGVHALMTEISRAITGVLDQTTLADTVKKSLRKIRRNKTDVPFVKMVLRRSPRKRKPAAKTVRAATGRGGKRRAGKPVAGAKKRSRPGPTSKQNR
ncbi:MAG: Rrf2 family transcriptional regulator [Chthoniobacteraceae bacterium]|nr:Rrf2 family transcriptional regulator [Chthoniobacteraceae bacterium]